MKPVVLLNLIFIFSTYVIAQDATLIYKNTVNSTVTIETDVAMGSGFFVAPNIIATNYHVVEGATEAFCFSNNSDKTYHIEGYLAVDRAVDLILLQVSNLTREPLPFSSSTVSPGQKIYVIGSPKGLPATISDGIVSGMRDFDNYKLIQMTAPISPGSSGGPVLNQYGELIGISVSQLTEGQNLNFAIPKSYLELLLQFKNSYPTDLANLSNGNSRPNTSGDTNGYSTHNYNSNVYVTDEVSFRVPELSLDFISHEDDNSCFYFTYSMLENVEKNSTIYLEDYRLVDNQTGEVYYGVSSDMPSQENSRIVYRGTSSRFYVCFDRLPASVKKFSLMEGSCGSSSFCFLNLNMDDYREIDGDEVEWFYYNNNDTEGTVSFYTNDNIGHIDIYIEDYFCGTLTKYFTDSDYIPTCGDIGDAILTLRLEEDIYNYSAVCGDIKWSGSFNITPECCTKLYFTND
jgi:hypothetical protein